MLILPHLQDLKTLRILKEKRSPGAGRGYIDFTAHAQPLSILRRHMQAARLGKSWPPSPPHGDEKWQADARAKSGSCTLGPPAPRAAFKVKLNFEQRGAVEASFLVLRGLSWLTMFHSLSRLMMKAVDMTRQEISVVHKQDTMCARLGILGNNLDAAISPENPRFRPE